MRHSAKSRRVIGDLPRWLQCSALAVWFAIVFMATFAFVTTLARWQDNGRIARLERTVACLQHPDHAISAAGPLLMKTGRPVGDATPSLEVCP